MTNADDPLLWVAPKWHEDYGNVAEELEHLRAAAIGLRMFVPQVQVQLEVVEEGYMHLAVQHLGRCISEIYSVIELGERAHRRYAVFLVCDEHEAESYTDTTEDVVSSIQSCLSR